jgi:hypothetical protein
LIIILIWKYNSYNCPKFITSHVDNYPVDIGHPEVKFADKMYLTCDVDPIITGQLYEYRDYIKNTYSTRDHDLEGMSKPSDCDNLTRHLPLSEYASDSSLLIEPYYKYVDDGMPKQWATPSTPIIWHEPHNQDFYGRDGPTPYTNHLYSLSEPDHLPLVS